MKNLAILTPILLQTGLHSKVVEDNPKLDDHGMMDLDDRSSYDLMTEKEKRHHLTEIFKKADVDENGTLSKQELERWMQKTTEKYLANDVDNQWPSHDTNADGLISWNEYYTSVFSHMTDEDFEDQNLSMQQLQERDQRRFNTADQDKDGNLSRREFAHFLHPEDFDHMKQIVVKETLEDLDLDGDGFVSEQEYIKDLYNNAAELEEWQEKHPDSDIVTDNKDLPSWLKMEFETFRTERDTNKDGKMDENEVKNWLMPVEFDHIEAEADHLIMEADKNKDNELSLDEVLADYDLFMTSQATNWGEALGYHDEL